MAAILCLLEQDSVFEAAIGSGITHSIEDWLEQCFWIVGRDWHEHVRLANSYKPKYPKLVSNPGTINSLGWKPATNFRTLAAMMVAPSTVIAQ